MEQLGFLTDTRIEKENEFCDNITEILNKNGSEQEERQIFFKKNKSHTTILFGENIACLKIVIGQKRFFFAVSPRFKKLLQENNILYSVEKSTMWLRVSINEPSDIFMYKDLIISLYDCCTEINSSYSFDCCSRYMQCSDALKCVNPYPEVFRYCKYKTKLKNGIVFYGKNRNI